MGDKEICAVCGAEYILHQQGTLQCPKGGVITPLNCVQEWENTVYEEFEEI